MTEGVASPNDLLKESLQCSAFAMRRHPEELLCFQHHSLHDEKYPGSVLLVLIHADFVSFIKGLQQTSCVLSPDKTGQCLVTATSYSKKTKDMREIWFHMFS